MSLRTKLLAAVVGLNGAILLLALFLLLRSEAESAPQPPRGVIADLPALGAAIGTCLSDEDSPTAVRDRAHARQILDDLRAAGVVTEVLVVEEFIEGESSSKRDHHVWRGEDYLESTRPAEPLPKGDPIRVAARAAFENARRNGRRWSWSSADTVAVVLPVQVGDDGRRGLVAHFKAPPDPRRGIRNVYLVMVVGVIVLTAVSFWLVSRLVIRPLGQLTEAADHIARGDYGFQVEPRGTDDELDRTIDAFRRMSREIAEYQGHLEDRVLSALNRMRKAEQHLAIAQRLAATGKLASGVAHEINNPLGGLKNAMRALSRGDLPPEKTAEYLELISEGLGRIEETVKKFLSFTPRQVEPRRTDLSSVAHKAGQLALHRIQRSGARLVEDLADADEAQVFGDPHELQQVALNLLLNAADAVAGSEDGRVDLRVRGQGAQVVLEVADNGVGLTVQDQDRCFDMFFTTKGVGEGTGLGLAVAHTIVTNHGGRLEVESRPGEGATFRVILPTEAEIPPPEEEEGT